MPEKIRKVHVQLAGNWIDSIDWMMEQKIQSPKEKDTALLGQYYVVIMTEMMKRTHNAPSQRFY